MRPRAEFAFANSNEIFTFVFLREKPSAKRNRSFVVDLIRSQSLFLFVMLLLFLLLLLTISNVVTFLFISSVSATTVFSTFPGHTFSLLLNFCSSSISVVVYALKKSAPFGKDTLASVASAAVLA